MSNTELAGSGFDFGVCFSGDVGRLLRSAPYLLVLRQSGSPAKTCPAWVTSTKSYATAGITPASWEQAISPARFNINFRKAAPLGEEFRSV
jgi:hypothetical protein